MRSTYQRSQQTQTIGIQRITALFSRLGLFGTGAVLAADTDQPIEISQMAMREEPSGKTTYRGDVVLTQGSLEIRRQPSLQFR